MAFAALISLGEGDESLKERGILSLQVSAMQKREGASQGESTQRKRTCRRKNGRDMPACTWARECTLTWVYFISDLLLF
ncbi:hypothetical protein C8R31_102401 [Nitrosospira sp. Nsp2]|nr:hypothetical protein C8R31_102401 [Nitrosospira sp. Nsp2]